MRTRFVLSCVAAVATSFAIGADKDVEDLLAKMREAYKGSKSAKMTVKSSLDGPIGPTEITATISYMGPDKFHAVLDMDGADLKAVSNGKKVVFSGPGGMQEFEPNEFFMPGLNLEALSFWEWKKQLSTEEGANMHGNAFKIVKDVPWKKQKWTVLEESAEDQEILVRYYIDPQTHLIWRTVVSNLRNREDIIGDYKLTKLQVGAKVDPKLFELGSKQG